MPAVRGVTAAIVNLKFSMRVVVYICKNRCTMPKEQCSRKMQFIIQKVTSVSASFESQLSLCPLQSEHPAHPIQRETAALDDAHLRLPNGE
jgi:hypothetical protein